MPIEVRYDNAGAQADLAFAAGAAQSARENELRNRAYAYQNALAQQQQQAALLREQLQQAEAAQRQREELAGKIAAQRTRTNKEEAELQAAQKFLTDTEDESTPEYQQYSKYFNRDEMANARRAAAYKVTGLSKFQSQSDAIAAKQALEETRQGGLNSRAEDTNEIARQNASTRQNLATAQAEHYDAMNKASVQNAQTNKEKASALAQYFQGKIVLEQQNSKIRAEHYANMEKMAEVSAGNKEDQLQFAMFRNQMGLLNGRIRTATNRLINAYDQNEKAHAAQELEELQKQYDDLSKEADAFSQNYMNSRTRTPNTTSPRSVSGGGVEGASQYDWGNGTGDAYPRPAGGPSPVEPTPFQKALSEKGFSPKQIGDYSRMAEILKKQGYPDEQIQAWMKRILENQNG